MAQLGGGFRLAQESRLDLALERHFRRQHLDRDNALEALVLGAIHDTHPATTDFAVQFVVGVEHALYVGAKLGTRRRSGRVNGGR